MNKSFFSKLYFHRDKRRSKFTRETLLQHWRYILIMYLASNVFMIVVTITILGFVSRGSEIATEVTDVTELNEENLSQAVQRQRYKSLVQKGLINYGSSVDHIQPVIKEGSQSATNQGAINF